MKKIDIGDRKIISSFIDMYQITTSEISFTNLFAWREKYNFHYIILDDYLWLINIKNDKYYLSQPIGNYDNLIDLTQSIESMEEFLNGKPFIIKKSDEKFLNTIRDMNFSYSYIGIRNDFDYLYDFEKMKSLSGNKYHKKKNHINQFLSKYDNWHYESLSIKNFKDVKEVCLDWFKDKKGDDLIELDAIYDVLLNFDELDISGGVLYIELKPVAFVIGERLNKNTLVMHFEKAISGYHGLYPMVFNQYIKSLEGYKYVNREQDLGIEGLRKSKLSYHPVDLIKKFNIRIGDK
ncbi:MAG: DUF2156 domain-containing protein [Clostridiales bacterium]|nr:DUF2156 domain-containing protein [Clostridiales bacterium]